SIMLMIEHARAGRRVVRFKGVDPFIFGRGGEECEALSAAGVRFEVVPGVTAAVAAAAYAGIVATHRDVNSSITIVTGHPGTDSETTGGESEAATDRIDYAALARLPCLAFYMPVARLKDICSNLILHGMDPQTPAALIERATTPRQRTVVSTLRQLPDDADAAGIAAPAVAVIGRVVELRGAIRWFDNRPLFGKTIVVTRTRQQASRLSSRLEELGANVLEAPTIQIVPPADWGPVDEALRSLDRADWLIFTSQNAAEFTRRRMQELGLDARRLANLRIAAVGPATAQAVQQHLFCRADLCPDSYVAEALADALESGDCIRGRRFILLRADLARPTLVARLRAAGAADVADIPIYETRLVDSLPEEFLTALEAGTIDWITFASSSSARNLLTLLGADGRSRLSRVKLASIGPATSRTLRSLDLPVDAEAAPYTLEGLIQAILAREGQPAQPRLRADTEKNR
ncbi:MAG: uroporphyrinogen-III synthase, partial [Phycisphaerae bacterium]|nr:uroporphyrinogen-III synthase [Phycisphaerae bacterium]